MALRYVAYMRRSEEMERLYPSLSSTLLLSWGKHLAAGEQKVSHKKHFGRSTYEFHLSI